MKTIYTFVAALMIAVCMPALLNAEQYSDAIRDAEELNSQISAFSLINTRDIKAISRAKGDLKVMGPFVAALVQSLSGVNIGPAAEIRSISVELEVKINNAQSESNLFKLGVEIVNNIGPLLARCRILLPSLIAELKKSNAAPVTQLKKLIAPALTATPGWAGPARAVGHPTVGYTPVAYRPTPTDPQPQAPGVGVPGPSAPPPPPGNPGLLPPVRVIRATATPQPWSPPAATLVPTTHSTPVGVLKAPAAMLMPTHQRWVYVAQVNVDQVAVIDTHLRRVITTIPVGRQPVALAMNSSAQKLIVVNHDSNDITVVDGNSQAVLGTVRVGLSPVDAVVTPHGKKAYVLNQGSNSVSVILLDSLQVLKVISVGAGPSRLEMESNGRTLYVSNTRSDTISIIDASVDEVVAEVAQ